MSLRVLEDERLGYAILEFDAALAAPDLSISIRSRLRQGAYLGPGGQWQRLPHYFPAQRVDGDASRTRYRVGPDIVNHMMEFDRVEVATEDKSLREETEWENAVPEISARSVHTLYVASGPSEREPQPAAGAEPSVAPSLPPPPEPEAAPPEPPPASKPAEPAAALPMPAATQPDAPPAPPPSPRPMPPWLAAVLALVLLVVGVQSWLLRCQLFGLACTWQHEPAPPVAQPVPPVASPSPPVAKSAPPVGAPAPPVALACAETLIESAPCGVPRCFTTPEARGRPEAQSILAKADAACRDDQEANKARSCVDTKHAAKQDCDIRSACIAPYLAAITNGRSRIDLEARGRDADVVCARQRAAHAPPPTNDPTALVGSKWTGTLDRWELFFEFRPDGKMKWWWGYKPTYWEVNLWEDATWTLTGDAIHINDTGCGGIYNKIAYEGKIVGNRMEGTAQYSEKNKIVTWSATKN